MARLFCIHNLLDIKADLQILTKSKTVAEKLNDFAILQPSPKYPKLR